MNRAPSDIILLTGFEPFGGETVNPSWEAVRAFDGKSIRDHRIVARCLPVEFGGATRLLSDLVDELRPVLVLGVGQAGGRARISIERVAINVIDARIPDNAGAQPIDVPVITGAPDAYFSTLPIKSALSALLAAGLPTEISQTAGTYVCNAAFFALMHALHGRAHVRGGFIHIPFAPEQAAHHPNAPSLSLDIVQHALHILLDVSLSTPVDQRLAAGTEH